MKGLKECFACGFVYDRDESPGELCPECEADMKRDEEDSRELPFIETNEGDDEHDIVIDRGFHEVES